jgi:hypothetical protein
MTSTPRDHQEEELSKLLTSEERAELEALLAEYIMDGKLDFEKVKVDSRYAKFESRIDPEQIYFWTPEWQAKEREADEDIAAGRWEEFDNLDDVFKV